MPIKPESMQKQSTKTTPTKKVEPVKQIMNFKSMTVKDLKAYAVKNKIALPSTARKAEIIEILEKSKKKKPNTRRQLPKIPSNDD